MLQEHFRFFLILYIDDGLPNQRKCSVTLLVHLRRCWISTFAVTEFFSDWLYRIAKLFYIIKVHMLMNNENINFMLNIKKKIKNLLLFDA